MSTDWTKVEEIVKQQEEGMKVILHFFTPEQAKKAFLEMATEAEYVFNYQSYAEGLTSGEITVRKKIKGGELLIEKVILNEGTITVETL